MQSISDLIFGYALQNSSVTVRKQHTVLFPHCVRLPILYLHQKPAFFVASPPRGVEFSPAGSVRVGSACHRHAFTTDPFDSLHINSKTQGLPHGGGPVFLVEMRGVEPLSENRSMRLSPGAASDQISLWTTSGARSDTGSHFVRDRLNGEPPMHGHRYMTFSLGSRYSQGERAAL